MLVNAGDPAGRRGARGDRCRHVHHALRRGNGEAAEMGMAESALQDTLATISLAGVATLDEVIPGSGDGGDLRTLGDILADRTDGPGAAYEDEETRRSMDSDFTPEERHPSQAEGEDPDDLDVGVEPHLEGHPSQAEGEDPDDE